MKKSVFFVFCALCVRSLAAEEGWFWHLTDFHWDTTFWENHLSCINTTNLTSDDYYGNQWCDSSWELIQASVSSLGQIKQGVDFVLWTGDSVPHIPSSALNTTAVEYIIKRVTDLMKQSFPNTPIYATFGNHDYYKSNMFPPHGNDIYNTTYDMWKTWVKDDSQTSNFLKGGYYTMKISPTLRIVALNTNMYYTKSTINQHLTDPSDQFAWMESTLANAERANEKVILAGHVPPGFTTPRVVRWMSKIFNQKFVDIVLRHSHVIVAMHFGHEHHDNFRLFYNDKGIPVVPLFIAPSVTPWRYQIGSEKESPHNPGVRLVKYNPITGKQLEIRQYYADIEKANRDRNSGIGGFQWIPGYNATTMYNIPDITAVSLDKVVKRMTGAQSPEFKNFVNWYNTNANASIEYPCGEACYNAVICGIKHMTETPFQQCATGTDPGSSGIVG